MEKSGNPQGGSPKNVAVGRIVMNAIRNLEGSKGISLPGLKKFLRDGKKMDVVQHDAEIKLSLKKGMDRGMLTKEDGNYKLKEAKRRRSRSRSKGAKKSRKRKSRSRSKGRKRSGRKKSGGTKKRSGSRKRRSRRRHKHTEGDGC